MDKIRVYELAKELNVENKVVIETLNDMGFSIKNHMSGVDDDICDRVTTKLSVKNKSGDSKKVSENTNKVEKTAESRVDTEAFVEPRSPIPAQAAAVELAVSSEEVLPPEDVLVEEGVLHVDDIQHSVELAPRYFWLDVESGERETTAAWAVEEAPSKHALRHIFSTSSATWPKGDVSHRLAMVVFGLIGLHSQYAKIYR